MVSHRHTPVGGTGDRSGSTGDGSRCEEITSGLEPRDGSRATEAHCVREVVCSDESTCSEEAEMKIDGVPAGEVPATGDGRRTPGGDKPRANSKRWKGPYRPGQRQFRSEGATEMEG